MQITLFVATKNDAIEVTKKNRKKTSQPTLQTSFATAFIPTQPALPDIPVFNHRFFKYRQIIF